MMKGRNAMQSSERRDRILDILKEKTKPVSGSRLSKKLGVSRQVIVQDIALLRASGINIFATPQGYILPRDTKDKIVKVIACHHNQENTKKELEIIVDNGGRIIDVIVEHPIYGEIKGMLMLNSRLDISEFMKLYKKTETKPLSFLTDGTHLHTIEVPHEEAFEKIIFELNKNGYLIKSM